MGVKEILLDRRKKEGIDIGEAKKGHVVVENLILIFAFSDEQAATAAGVTVDFVKKVRQKLAAVK